MCFRVLQGIYMGKIQTHRMGELSLTATFHQIPSQLTSSMDYSLVSLFIYHNYS